MNDTFKTLNQAEIIRKSQWFANFLIISVCSRLR